MVDVDISQKMGNLHRNILRKPINGYRVITLVDEELLRKKHLSSDELYSFDRLLLLRDRAKKDLERLCDSIPTPTIVKIEKVLNDFISSIDELER